MHAWINLFASMYTKCVLKVYTYDPRCGDITYYTNPRAHTHKYTHEHESIHTSPSSTTPWHRAFWEVWGVCVCVRLCICIHICICTHTHTHTHTHMYTPLKKFRKKWKSDFLVFLTVRHLYNPSVFENTPPLHFTVSVKNDINELYPKKTINNAKREPRNDEKKCVVCVCVCVCLCLKFRMMCVCVYMSVCLSVSLSLWTLE